MHWTRIQVGYGPRPAGSAASRALGPSGCARALPHGRFQAVPGGLRNVIARVPGRDRRDVVVIGAHYDTKDIPGFLGANDGAAGTAVVLELARHLRPRAAAGHARYSRSSTARRARPARPTRSSSRGVCAAARWRPSRSAAPGR